jgi:hypothetical protein
MRYSWEIERSLERAIEADISYYSSTVDELNKLVKTRYSPDTNTTRASVITAFCLSLSTCNAELPRLVSPTLKFRQCRGQPPVCKVIISAPVLARHDRSGYFVDI